jgi:hypothetical protein
MTTAWLLSSLTTASLRTSIFNYNHKQEKMSFTEWIDNNQQVLIDRLAEVVVGTKRERQGDKHMTR